jgi:TonB-dependent receptor
MYKTHSFKKKILATVVASSSLGLSSFALAQDAAEEIVITGIKASLTRAMDIKRDAVGVVDAISAEDMGKMPDSNLAESLQRITGVSIERANGEGSKVTVRGFGPDFNLVTLNGRAAASASFDSRSFDFGNLASEGVAGLEVYKTGRANVASGGIGASINIKTLRPLDKPGLHASVGGKLLNDTTNRTGSDVTPEASFLLSDSFADDTIGVALTGSYQKRDSGTTGAYVNQWNVKTLGSANDLKVLPNAVIENGPAVGGKYILPSDLRYTIGDQERERTNGQLTLQFKPTDKINATLDYTYSKNDWSQQRIEQTLWFVDTRSHIVFDNSPIKAPLMYSEWVPNPKDLSFARQVQGSIQENNAVGLNVSFDVTDDLNLTFDYSDSKAALDPHDPRASNLNVTGALGNIIKEQSVNFNAAVPVMWVKMDDSQNGANNNGKFDAGDVSMSRANAQKQVADDEIKQARLDGTWKFDDKSIKFGAESRKNAYLGLEYKNDDMSMGDWSGAAPSLVPDAYYTPRNFLSEFDGYDTTGSWKNGMDWDFETVTAWAEGEAKKGTPGFFGTVNGKYQVKPDPTTYRDIQEDVQAGYVMFDMPGELGGKAFHFNTGVRYEHTDVTASTLVNPPTQVRWTGDNDLQTDYSSTQVGFARDASYSHVLPNIDFDINLADNVKGRVSLSKTIARANYGLLKADTSVSGNLQYNIGEGRQASAGNPGLKPVESKNFDASIEWYYDDSSYVSLGYYRKDIDKFNSTATIDSVGLFGLRDVTQGPRTAAAKAQLIAGGNANPSIQQIYSQLAKNEGQVDTNGNGKENANILPNSGDPLATWHVDTPVNNKSGVIDGFEFAIQHMFGDSGFGVQANYTTVNGSVAYDNAKSGIPQFALTGLSDTANLMAFYEKDGYSARVTYNWRDKFLYSTNVYNNEPGYTASYESFDATLGYEINENLSVSLEALNLLGADKRNFGRAYSELLNLEVLGPRYTLGARYTF